MTKNDKVLKVLEGKALGNSLAAEELEDIRLKPLRFKEFNQYILKFLITYSMSFPECNKAFLVNNLNNLDIYVNCDNISVYIGNYNEEGNYISMCLPDHYEEEELVNTLSHELLHMASHNSCSKNNNTGFSQMASYVLKDNIGYGLNEGYTEYLTLKYFSTSDSSPFYSEEQVLSKKIEELIGQDTMQKAYFTGDLYSIIKGIEKYSNLDESIEIIRGIDKLGEEDNLYDEISNKLDNLIKIKHSNEKRYKYER